MRLTDGTKFYKSDFRKLLKNDSNEFRICHKLTEKHLSVRGRERMNVKMAMQLYSRTVANCFKSFFKFDKRIQRLATFVELVNDFADLLNSRYAADKNFTGSTEQMRILDQMETEIKGK
jgi:hypothetical protein